MRRAIKTEAIVLRKRSLPNQDKIITLFSRELGKVSAFAKGIKKITSRRLPHAQTANLIEAVLYKKDDWYYLQQTSLISGFSEIKKDQIKLQFLYQFFFVAERLTPENQPESEVYNLLLNFLIDLDKSQSDINSLLLNYLNKLIKQMGYSKEEKSYAEICSTVEEIIHEKIPELHI